MWEALRQDERREQKEKNGRVKQVAGRWPVAHTAVELVL